MASIGVMRWVMFFKLLIKIGLDPDCGRFYDSLQQK